MNECRAAFDYVITTGGIGPTHDDITSECVAEAFGVGMYRDPETVELIRSFLRGGEMNEARMRMATFPEGAELIGNPVSAAPGYRKENVFVLAGVPQIMQAMFDGMKHHLSGGSRMQARAVHVHLPEGAIAEALGELQDRFPEIDIGSYPAMRQRRFGVSVVLRANRRGGARPRARGGQDGTGRSSAESRPTSPPTTRPNRKTDELGSAGSRADAGGGSSARLPGLRRDDRPVAPRRRAQEGQCGSSTPA